MNFLYFITIYPIELAFLALFKLFSHFTGSFGVGILMLSVFTTILYVPLKHMAANLHRKEQLAGEIMGPQLAQIKATLHGAERQAAVNRLYYRYAYHPLLAMRSSVGVLIQVPFLIAAYNMIHGFGPLAGHSFGFLADLSQPDALLGSVNLLPFVMTAVNLVAVWTTPGFTKRDLGQAAFVAALFLMLLYGSPSALLVYWTSNNALYFVGNMLHRSKGFAELGQRTRKALARFEAWANPVTVALAFLTAFALFVYFPCMTYLRNLNEFNFDGLGLMLGLIGPFLVTLVAAYLALRALSIALPQHKARWFSAEATATVGHAALLALMFASLLEGILLSRGLHILNGEGGLFDSTPRLLLDLAAWALIVGLAVRFKKFVFDQMPLLMGVAALAMVIGLADAYQSKGEKIPPSLTAEDVLKAMAFNQDKNVIIISVDTLPTETTMKILGERPELAAEFTGFTLFQNDLYAGGGTNYAIPQMLRGKVYREGDFVDFVQGVISDGSSLPNVAAARGYDAFISTGMPGYNFIEEDGAFKELEGVRNFNFNAYEFKQFVFRFVPYAAKKLLNEELSAPPKERIDKSLESAAMDHNAQSVFKYMVASASRQSDRPTLHFHHYMGVHRPYRHDESGVNTIVGDERYSNAGLKKASTWELKCLAQYLDFLREQGLYDSSLIVITADHGQYDETIQEFAFPLLMVKPAEAQGSLDYSPAPTSNAYLVSLFDALDSGQSLAQWEESLPETRTCFEPPNQYYPTVTGVDKHALDFGKAEPIPGFWRANILALGHKYPLSPSMVPLGVEVAKPYSFSGFYLYLTLIGFSPDAEGEGVMTFLTEAKDRRVTVRLTVSVDGTSDVVKTEPFFPLTLRDVATGETLFSGDLHESKKEIVLPGVAVNGEGKFTLGFSTRPGSTQSHLRLRWVEVE